MPILNDKEYQCDWCDGIFNFINDETWSREKADEEYKQRFPNESSENRVIVCDDCNTLMMNMLLNMNEN